MGSVLSKPKSTSMISDSQHTPKPIVDQQFITIDLQNQ